MGYKKDVIKGVSWTGSLSFSTKAIGFLETLILARILAPEQFGAYAIALLALGLLEVITETGVNIFLVQEKEIDHYISSAWIVSILRGIVISVMLFISAPFIADFFHSPLSLSLLYFVSIVPFLRGFINPSVVKFQKELMFRKDFWYKFIILTIDTVVSITVTYITKSPIGIVIGLLSGVVVEMVLSYFIVGPRPTLQFDKGYIAKIFHRGKWITASSIFDYLFHNADNIIVGRLLGSGALGVYQLAYAIAVVPLTEVGKVFIHVVFPIFVKIGGDKIRLQQAIMKVLLSILSIAIPVVLVLFFFPNIFILLLGAKWSGLTNIIPILALVGLVKALTTISSAIFLSEKKQNYGTLTNFITIIVLIALIIPLVSTYGTFGAGLAVLISLAASLPVTVYLSLKLLKYI